MKFTEIIGWFGLEGTFKITQFQPPAIGRDTSLQPRLLTAPSSLACSAPREGASTANLGGWESWNCNESSLGGGTTHKMCHSSVLHCHRELRDEISNINSGDHFLLPAFIFF